MKKREVEAQLRAHCKTNPHTVWIDVKWLEALGRERVSEIVAEYGFGELQPTVRRAAR